MPASVEGGCRTVAANHGRRTVNPDPAFEVELAVHLAKQYSPAGLIEQYARFGHGEGAVDFLMRRALLRAVARKFGSGVRIEAGVQFKHPETFEIGDEVFIGAQTFIQG